VCSSMQSKDLGMPSGLKKARVSNTDRVNLLSFSMRTSEILSDVDTPPATSSDDKDALFFGPFLVTR
jgi:hypothetical protein